MNDVEKAAMEIFPPDWAQGVDLNLGKRVAFAVGYAHAIEECARIVEERSALEPVELADEMRKLKDGGGT